MPDNGRKAFGDIAPALAQYTDDVLFGDVWERPGLKPRDRSLVTIACLISLYRTNELPFHLKKARWVIVSMISSRVTPFSSAFFR